jgi:hypothetical protein
MNIIVHGHKAAITAIKLNPVLSVLNILPEREYFRPYCTVSLEFLDKSMIEIPDVHIFDQKLVENIVDFIFAVEEQATYEVSRVIKQTTDRRAREIRHIAGELQVKNLLIKIQSA